MNKEQAAIIFVMAVLITIATTAFIQNLMLVHGLSSKVLPRILIGGPAVNFTGNSTDLEAEIAQQAIESCDDENC